MGRRGVQQLTPAQWREALEQQIREKQQQQEEAEQPQRRSQSAPHQDEAVPTLPGLERAATTASDGQAPGRRRRVQPQSREEYLRELQEQIEEKKRQAGQSKRRSRGDDEGGGGGESERLAESKSANTRADAKAPADLQQRLEDAKVDASSNQLEDDPCHPAVLQADVAADPGAITKIVDFCEELKRQNEDVKRQLLEQHAVLASLHSTLAVEADGKASGPILRRRSRGSVDKLRVNIEESDPRMSSNTGKAEVKDPEAKVTMLSKVVPRPRPMRGDTKIPFPGKRISSSLRLAGADIVKGVVLEHAAQPKSPLQRVEAGSDTCDRSLQDILAIEEIPQLNEIAARSLESPFCTEVRTSPETTLPEVSEDKEWCRSTCAEEDGERRNSDKRTTSIQRGLWATESSHSDEECPMDAESKLVHGWEQATADDEPLDCTSISILDGLSSLISIDKPLSDLFH